MHLSIVRALLRRLARFAVVLFGVSTVVFLAVRLAGDPAAVLIPQGASAAEVATLRRELGLDQPFVIQFALFWQGILHGDFGRSAALNQPALNAVLQALPVTLQLTAAALLIVIVVGVPLGVAAAVWRGGWVDALARTIATLTQAMPSFWLGLVLIVIFAVKLRWFPASGWGSLEEAVLPAMTLALYSLGRVSRLMRGSMLEAMSQAWTLTARAKGLFPRRIVWVHQFRNALVPVVTLLGVEMGILLSGAVITETVFGIPGMGRLAVTAVLGSDYAVVQASVFVAALLITGINLLADTTTIAIDPRLRN